MLYAPPPPGPTWPLSLRVVFVQNVQTWNSSTLTSDKSSYLAQNCLSAAKANRSLTQRNSEDKSSGIRRTIDWELVTKATTSASCNWLSAPCHTQRPSQAQLCVLQIPSNGLTSFTMRFGFWAKRSCIRIPVETRFFLFSRTSWPPLGHTQNHIQREPGFISRGKWAEADIQNKWSCTYTPPPPKFLHGVQGDNYTFTFLHLRKTWGTLRRQNEEYKNINAGDTTAVSKCNGVKWLCQLRDENIKKKLCVCFRVKWVTPETGLVPTPTLSDKSKHDPLKKTCSKDGRNQFQYLQAARTRKVLAFQQAINRLHFESNFLTSSSTASRCTEHL